MARRQEKTKRHKPKTILRFPDLEQSKNAVVNSLAAASSQESYGHAIDEFIGWYCSEPRLAFNRTVVLPTRRCAAACLWASDSGLLSPELAAGIRRVKGAKRLGTRIGNWLTADRSCAHHVWLAVERRPADPPQFDLLRLKGEVENLA